MTGPAAAVARSLRLLTLAGGGAPDEHDPAGQLGQAHPSRRPPDQAQRAGRGQQGPGHPQGQSARPDAADNRGQRRGKVLGEHRRVERPQRPVHLVELGQAGAATARVVQGFPTGAPVPVHGGQARVIAPHQAGLGQPEAEVLVGVVRGREVGRVQADPQAVGSPHRHVAQPQVVQGPVEPLLHAGTVRDVVARVQEGPDVGTASRELHRHRADEDEAGLVGVRPGVGTGQAGHRDHVVVEQQHHLGVGHGDAELERAQLTRARDLCEDEPIEAVLERSQEGHRLGVLPVDDDHVVPNRLLGEDDRHELREVLGTTPGGRDHRDAGDGRRHAHRFVPPPPPRNRRPGVRARMRTSAPKDQLTTY